MMQLSLFTPQFDDRIRRQEVDGVTYFSVLDVFHHYGKAKNPTTSWKTALKRLENQGFDRAREILDKQMESGGRPTPFATLTTIRAFWPIISPFPLESAGYIYILHFQEYPDQYKVGLARDIKARMKAYRTENPPALHLVVDAVYRTPDCAALERLCKIRLEARRIRGEWFSMTSDEVDDLKGWLTQQAAQLGEMMGIDLATGRALVTA